MERMLAETVDRMKTSPDPIPVVVVGGGSVLLGDALPGASRLVRPDHFAVANAIGAAIAQVGGEVERVFSLDQLTRDAALDQAKSEAVDKAVAAGATASSVRIVDVEDVPLPYIPGNATRIKVKAVGDLEIGRFEQCVSSARSSSTILRSARPSSAPAAAAIPMSARCSRGRRSRSMARSRSSIRKRFPTTRSSCRLR